MEKEFADNVKKYNPMIYSFINKTHVKGYEREDLYQEALLVLYESMNEFDSSKGVKFSTYLYIKLRNKMYDLIKKNKEITLVGNQDNLIDNIISFDDDLDDDEYSSDVESDILEALLKMPRGNITYLIIYENKTQKEIAEMEGITQQRVNYLHKRNLRKLREIFLTIL